MQHIKGLGSFQQQVVGEQHYQDALIRIAGPYGNERKRIRCEAVLYLQPDNPHDHNAIRVEIDNATVGYIPREQASQLRQQLGRLGIGAGQRLTVAAMIGGGLIGTRYGVYLDFDEPLEIKALPPTAAAYQPPPPVIKPTAVATPSPTTWRSEDETLVPSQRRRIDMVTSHERGIDNPAPGHLRLWVVGLLFVVMVGIVAVGGWYASTLPQTVTAPTVTPGGLRLHTPTPDAAEAPRRTPRPPANNRAAGLMVLACADCAATGTAANVWRTPQMAQVACRLLWGEQVERISHRPDNGGMSEIRASGCKGWVRDSLLQAR